MTQTIKGNQDKMAEKDGQIGSLRTDLDNKQASYSLNDQEDNHVEDQEDNHVEDHEHV